MASHVPVVGLVSFIDARPDAAGAVERDRAIWQKHKEMNDYLTASGFRVVSPQTDGSCPSLQEGPSGITTYSEVDTCVRALRQGGVECLVMPCISWAQPMRPLRLIRDLNKPVLLYAEREDKWAGGVMLTALGASLWETAPSANALNHERVFGDMEEVRQWVLGVSALEYMRNAVMLLYGGTYCEGMAHLMDDIPALHSFLVGDIVTVDTSELILAAQSILEQSPERPDAFINWLGEQGASIKYDESMLTCSSLRHQSALYLAARDHIRAYPEPVAGVSIRCQPELSVKYGCTGCLLPAFLPFHEDNEGRHGFVPTVCEGDIKGLITSVALSAMAGVPPLFGDLKALGKEYITISNCGASSVYYAAHSADPAVTMPKVHLSAQCQGASGAAVGYRGQASQMTVARMLRVDGEYFMQLGLGNALEVTDAMASRILWGTPWPHVCIDLGTDPALFQKIAGSNHYSAIPGDFTASMESFCRQAGIRVLRIDGNDNTRAAYETLCRLTQKRR